MTIVSDGITFSDVRGDSFAGRWTVPAHGSLAATPQDMTFNSVGTPQSLLCKLKSPDGTRDYRGCFEDWEIDARLTLLSAVTTLDQELFRIGWHDINGVFMGARITSHPANAAHLFATLMTAGSITGSIPSGYAYSIGNAVRVRVKRLGDKLKMTLNFADGPDIPVEKTMTVATSDRELPRGHSVPVIHWFQGNFRLDSCEIKVGWPNPKLLIAATSLGQGRNCSAYPLSYAQRIKASRPAGEVMVCAAPSATSAQWASFLAEAIELRPQEILFEIYANDMALVVPLTTTQASTASTIAQCAAAGIAVRFFNCPPHNWYAGPINAHLASLPVPQFDIFSLLVAPGGNYALKPDYGASPPHIPDGLHWGDLGNETIATPAIAWLATPPPVIQSGSKNAPVTANALRGQIVTAADALAANSCAEFTVKNNLVKPGARVFAQLDGGTGAVGYHVDAGKIVDGAFRVCICNGTGASRAEALTIGFMVWPAG